MSVVIDASVIVAALSSSADNGAWAERILASGDLVAPALVLVESTNILRRMELVGELTGLEANFAQRDLMLLPMDLVPFEPFADRVWELRHNVTSYDAWYVAIAEAFELPLATLDRKLAKSPGPRCEFLIPSTPTPIE